jgi:hypothetical protein
LRLTVTLPTETNQVRMSRIQMRMGEEPVAVTETLGEAAWEGPACSGLRSSQAGPSTGKNKSQLPWERDSAESLGFDFPLVILCITSSHFSNVTQKNGAHLPSWKN